jgi:hypothetical protein
MKKLKLELETLLENMWLDKCVNHSFYGGTNIVGFQ